MNIENSDSRYFRVKTMTKALNIPGKMISLGSHSAFVPAPLPPALEWTPRLIRILSDADRLIGRLAGEAGGCPILMFRH